MVWLPRVVRDAERDAAAGERQAVFAVVRGAGQVAVDDDVAVAPAVFTRLTRPARVPARLRLDPELDGEVVGHVERHLRLDRDADAAHFAARRRLEAQRVAGGRERLAGGRRAALPASPGFAVTAVVALPVDFSTVEADDGLVGLSAQAAASRPRGTTTSESVRIVKPSIQLNPTTSARYRASALAVGVARGAACFRYLSAQFSISATVWSTDSRAV